MKYCEEDLLLLSGIQHLAFCERQWALIHIEQVWAENIRTVEGKHLHERADDPFEDETRKNIRVVRAMPVVSYMLGLRGVADVVELHKQDCAIKGTTIQIQGRDGWWKPYPVEYKRGNPKKDDRDAVQLCAQAIALEEMMEITIEKGYLYYGQIKHRVQILFETNLRERTKELSEKMHELFREGKTPAATTGKNCSLCSLKEMCQPNLTIHHRSIKSYIQRMSDLEEEDV